MPWWMKQDNVPPTWNFIDGGDDKGGGGGADDKSGGADDKGGHDGIKDPPVIPEWRQGLPDDIKDSKDLMKFDSVEALAKSYIHASSMIGRDKIPMPKTDEEWDQVYNRLGRPEKPDLYEIAIPESMPEKLAVQMKENMPAFRKMAHKHGLSMKQATGLYEDWTEMVSHGARKESEMAKIEKEEATQTLKKEYGQAYDAKVHLANRAIDRFASPELVELLATSGLGRNPHMVKAFVQIGELIAEDLGLDKHGNQLETPQDIQDKIDELQAGNAYLDESDPKHNSVVRQVKALMDRLYKDQPVT